MPPLNSHRDVAETRKEALASGALYYKMKKPCINGHQRMRLALSNHCIDCNLVKTNKRGVAKSGGPINLIHSDSLREDLALQRELASAYDY